MAPAETKVDSSLFSDMSPEPDLSYPADNRITNPLTVDPTTSAVKQTKVAPSMPPGHSSFTKLAKDEDGTEFEEEKPYTSTKRPLFTNNGNDPCATSRPTRRAVSAQFLTMPCKAADPILALFFPRGIPNSSNPKERLTMLACDTSWPGRLTATD